MLVSEIIFYEYPLEEIIRICVRLEYLFKKISFWMHGNNTFESGEALRNLLELILILDKPDFKTKLLQELSQYLVRLDRYKQTSHVDKEKLRAFFDQIHGWVTTIALLPSRLAQPLREQYFINAIHQTLLKPISQGGIESPIFYYWLTLSPQERTLYFTKWLSPLEEIKAAIHFLLQFVRESQRPQEKIATSGSYRLVLDQKIECQLVNIGIPKDQAIFPQMNIGRFGGVIRFFSWDAVQTPSLIKKDLPFLLTCCGF